MIRFRLFGIPITVLPWFWITLAIIGAGSLSNADDLFRLLLFVLAGFFSVLVHELGHGLTIKKLGAPTEIVLQAFGGFATYPKGRFNRKENFLVTAAGPAIQLILGAIALVIYRSLSEDMVATMGGHFLLVLCGISFFWALFNLLPIVPMDGGQLLNAVLGPKRQNITYIVGIITAIGIGILALNFKLLIATLFMGYFAYQNFQLLRTSRQS
jgi:Zn-dependent protease